MAYNSAFTGAEIDTALGQVSNKADRTLSNLTDYAQAVYNLGAASNPNLLDNWYFADPIDQRRGYVVPPDTPYYSDSGLTTQVGTMTYHITATYVNGVYGTITVGGVTYYVDWTAAVRGYLGEGYSIDRWRGRYGGGDNVLTIHDGYVTIYRPTEHWSHLNQNVLVALPGKVITVSVLLSNAQFFVRSSSDVNFTNITPITNTAPVDDEVTLQTLTMTVPDDSVGLIVDISGAGQKQAKVIAAKLELGDRQTLARQLEDGTWEVIDPPPNKALELAKCQRYQIELNNLDSPYSHFGIGLAKQSDRAYVLVPLPVTLRGRPSVTTSGDIVLMDLESSTEYPVTSIVFNQVSANTITLDCTTAGGLVAGAAYYLRATKKTPYGKILIDSNL